MQDEPQAEPKYCDECDQELCRCCGRCRSCDGCDGLDAARDRAIEDKMDELRLEGHRGWLR